MTNNDWDRLLAHPLIDRAESVSQGRPCFAFKTTFNREVMFDVRDHLRALDISIVGSSTAYNAFAQINFYVGWLSPSFDRVDELIEVLDAAYVIATARRYPE